MPAFFSPYRHGFVRVGACVPQVAVAEPAKNGDQVLALLAQGDKAGLALMVFPELCLSAYAIDDLLFQDAVLDAVVGQSARLLTASKKLSPVFVVGAPLRWSQPIFTCVVETTSVLRSHEPVENPTHVCAARSEGCARPSIQIIRGRP